MEGTNYLAAVAAAISTFVIGGLWYSPLMFHKAWATTNRLTEADLKGGEARIFGIAFVMALIMAFNLAAFFGGPDATVGWVAPAIATIALFERRPFAYTAINGGTSRWRLR